METRTGIDNTCGTTLIAAICGHLTPMPTHRSPVNAGQRQKILGFRLSPCPQRSIYCAAFHPTLSTGGSLWMRLQFYLRLCGLH